MQNENEYPVPGIVSDGSFMSYDGKFVKFVTKTGLKKSKKFRIRPDPYPHEQPVLWIRITIDFNLLDPDRDLGGQK